MEPDEKVDEKPPVEPDEKVDDEPSNEPKVQLVARCIVSPSSLGVKKYFNGDVLPDEADPESEDIAYLVECDAVEVVPVTE